MDHCTLPGAFQALNVAVFSAAWMYLGLLFMLSIAATPLVMALYRRRITALMSSANPAAPREVSLGPLPTRAAPRQPVPPQALLQASHERQRRLVRVLSLACAVFAVVAGVMATLSPDVVMNTDAPPAPPRGTGLLLALAALDVAVIGALCMPMVLIGTSHPHFTRLYWRVFVPWLLVATTLRMVLAAQGDSDDRGAAGVLAVLGNLLFAAVFYVAVARRHARQVGPLAGVLVGTVVGGLALGGAFLFIADACGKRGQDALLLLFGLGTLVLPLAGLWLAWVAMRRLALGYEHKAFSDAQVQTASWMLCLTAITAVVVLGVERQQAGPWLPLLLAATLAAVATYGLGLRRVPPWPEPRSLLLLRVFAHDERGERLLDETAYRWRFVGPIHMIGGPDMAQQSMEPHELVAFIRGRADRQFVTTPEQLQQRLLSLDEAPDPDRRYRVNELFCQGEIWKTAVRALAGRCDAVLLDLRGFTEQRRGTAHEVALLAMKGLLPRTVCLVDASTDLDHVHRVIAQARADASLAQAQVLRADQGLQAEALFEALAQATLRRAATPPATAQGAAA